MVVQSRATAIVRRQGRGAGIVVGGNSDDGGSEASNVSAVGCNVIRRWFWEIAQTCRRPRRRFRGQSSVGRATLQRCAITDRRV